MGMGQAAGVIASVYIDGNKNILEEKTIWDIQSKIIDQKLKLYYFKDYLQPGNTNHSYAQKAIEKLAIRGLLSIKKHYDEYELKPEEGITRGDFIVMVMKVRTWLENNLNVATNNLCGKDKVKQKNPFLDVKTEDKRFFYIDEARNNCIVSGYKDDGKLTGDFGPDNELNRAEATKIILSAFGFAINDNFKKIFDDVLEEQWFAKFVQTAHEKGIITGYTGDTDSRKGLFKPNNPIIRAEAAIIIYKVMDMYYRGEKQ
jgi:hypothetical protein